MLSISFRKYCDEKREDNFLIIKMQTLFACAIIMSTARASSVFHQVIET